MRHRFSQLLWLLNSGRSLLLFFGSNLKITAFLFLPFLFFPSAAGLTVSMDGEDPTGNVIRQVNQPTRVLDLLASQLTMIILALSIVALRLIGRFFVDKNPGWDDYAIIAATVNKIEPLKNR